MLLSVTLRRSSDSATASVSRRHASFNALITKPTTPKMRMPINSLLLAGTQEPVGSIQKYSAAVPAIAVVTMPGHRPPSHALTMIAGNSVMYGSLVPQMGSRARRSRTAATAVPTATT